MFHSESRPIRQEANPDNQSSINRAGEKTLSGSELRLERAEQEIEGLLIVVSKKLGKPVTLEDLPNEFGEPGEEVKKCFQQVQDSRREYESAVSLAHLFTAVNNIEKQVEGQH